MKKIAILTTLMTSLFIGCGDSTTSELSPVPTSTNLTVEEQSTTESAIPHPEFDLTSNNNNSLGMLYTHNTPLKATELLRSELLDGFLQCSYKDSVNEASSYFVKWVSSSTLWQMNGSVIEKNKGLFKLVTANVNVYTPEPKTSYKVFTRNTNGVVSEENKNLSKSDIYDGLDGQTYYLQFVCSSQIRGNITNVQGSLLSLN